VISKTNKLLSSDPLFDFPTQYPGSNALFRDRHTGDSTDSKCQTRTYNYIHSIYCHLKIFIKISRFSFAIHNWLLAFRMCQPLDAHFDGYLAITTLIRML
jgi:hypothetical protein